MALFLFNKGKGVQSMSEKNVRLKKRKLTCGIKNCRERESRYITKSGDFQNTPNLCDDCLEKAYELISPLENVRVVRRMAQYMLRREAERLSG